MRTALITAIGSFSADVVIKSLKKLGMRIVGTDIYPKTWIADALNVDVFYQVPKAIDEKSYFSSIEEICRKEKVTHVLPLTDVEVDFYNANRSFFENNNILLCISAEPVIKICRNKKLQQEFISKNIPDMITIPSCYAEQLVVPPYDYPIIAKPYDGRSSIGFIKIMNEKEWRLFKEKVSINKYIVQPYINGNVVTVDIVSDGSDVVAIPRLELLRTSNGAGTSVKVYTDKFLEDLCIQLAKKLQVIGCVNMEYLRDSSGQYHYIECNPRFSGGVEFSCIAGYDCVTNHIRCFEKQKIDAFQLNSTYYIARKYEEYVTQKE